MTELKLIQIGNSVGVVIPKEILAALKLDKGDSLYISDAPDGLRITRADPRFAEQMDEARKIMKKRRTVLRELAK